MSHVETSPQPQQASRRIDRRRFLGICAAGVAAAGVGPSLGLAAPAAEAKPTRTAPSAMWALTGLLKSADVNRQLDAFAAARWDAVLYPR